MNDKDAIIVSEKAEVGSSSEKSKLATLSRKIDALGAESRGIERILPSERDPKFSKVHMFFLWCSGCGSLTSASGFFLGPIVYELSLRDAMAAGIMGALCGAVFSSFASTFGPRSGLRQMVGTRIFFGWYFSRFCCLLNFISNEGFSIINCVFGGQILTAMSNGKVPLEVGIVIISIVGVLVAIFGIRLVHMYHKVMSIPIMIMFLLTFICASNNFNNNTPSSGDTSTRIGRGLSYFVVTFGTNSGWSAMASDYYVLFPEDTPTWLTFFMTFLGISLPSVFVGAMAICIASGVSSNAHYKSAYDEGGNGALLAASLERWHGGGKFILVMLFISLISNNVLNTYSIPLAIQVAHSAFLKVPRWLLTIIGFVIYLACSLGGRNKLSDYLNNFLPMIGYWTSIYGTIMAEELLFFRARRPFEWVHWNDKRQLTHGIAGSAAFICGIPGAVVGMCQVYYTGPIAKRIGDHGGDVALWFCIAFTGFTYPIFRFLELKKFGK